MSKQGFTPGPWTITGPYALNGDLKFQKLSVDGAMSAVALIHIHHGYGEANAHLISAAPDLLAALEEAIECGLIPSMAATRHSCRQFRCGDQVRAAIAKAKGEA